MLEPNGVVISEQYTTGQNSDVVCGGMCDYSARAVWGVTARTGRGLSAEA